jgi:hypothetical protein
MKYLNIFLVLIIICFLSCRKKYPEQINYYKSFKSSIDGTFNDKPWQKNNWKLLGVFEGLNPTPYSNLGVSDSSNYAYCVIEGDRFRLDISQFNELDYLRESLIVIGISKKVKRYGVIAKILPSCDIKDSVSINFFTSQADGDVAKDFYDKIDTKNPNFFELTEYKPNQVKGSFDIKLIMTRRRDTQEGIYPEILHLKGSFDIKK